MTKSIGVNVWAQALLVASLAGCSTGEDLLSSSTNQAVTTEPDQVLAWNQVAVTVVGGTIGGGAPQQNPLYQTRQMAMVHAAVYDAVQGVQGDFQPYAVALPAPADATANAAAAGAAHWVLTHQTYVPPLSAALVAQIDNAWNNLPPSIATNSGIAYGEQVAQQILALRSTDGTPVPPLSPYHAPNEGQPLVWVPLNNGPALGVTWGNVTPWVLNEALQFDPGPPPEFGSEIEVRDREEVYAVGGNTQDPNSYQANVGKFWILPAAIIWNPLGRDASVANNLTVSENSRLFLRLNVAQADAAISCWATKFQYNYWRPITAVRTTIDPAWTPLIGTPPFPEYTSGHAAMGAAAARVLQDEFGDDPGIALQPTSFLLPTFSHTWATFSEGVDEIINARVWGGVHFRNSDEVGADIGRKIGRYTISHTGKHQEHGTHY
jgi:hypothetical protein